MTRQEAVRVLKYLWIERDENAKLMQQLTTRFFERQEALRMGAAALRGPQPDPKTGLVPCGCGGQAVFEGSFLDEEVPSSYRVSLSCVECGISTIAYEYEQEAMKAWNTAMGWKGGAE